MREQATVRPQNGVSGEAEGGTLSTSGGERRTIQLGETFFGHEGRYEVLRSLGRGGMADVWLARCVRAAGFRRYVALKCVTPFLQEDERIRGMLLAEAQLAGKLSHPNIVEAHDVMRLGERYYLVLEYVDGVSARAALEAARGQGKQLSEGFGGHVVASVADALDYAHGLEDAEGRPLGFVHRDVKAANVMVARSGYVKLLDFGVSCSLVEGRKCTRTGELKGTWNYFSPEQARGEAEVVDGRSDLFSLGVVLVELLTGTRPFEADSFQTIAKIVECDALEVDRATAELPAALREICKRALAKNPSDRFQSGAEFAKELRECLIARHAVYGFSECARELRELGLGPEPGTRSAPPETGLKVAPTEGWDGKSDWPSEGRGEPAVPKSRQAWRGWLLMLVGVMFGGGLGASAPLVLKRIRPEVDAPASLTEGTRPPPAASAEVPPEPKVATTQVEPAGEGRPAEPPARSSIASSYDPLDDLVIVRPKRLPGKGRTAPSKVVPPRAQDQGPAEPSEGAAAATEVKRDARPSATLERGTLIHATLARAIDAQMPGSAEAVVSEDVRKGDRLLVPRGSGMVCYARRGEEGRVGLSCDEIKTGSGEFSFTGIGVGEGGHVGLRPVDGVVESGTDFVVYVSAAAVW